MLEDAHSPLTPPPRMFKAEDEAKAVEMVESVIKAWNTVFEEHSDWLNEVMGDDERR